MCLMLHSENADLSIRATFFGMQMCLSDEFANAKSHLNPTKCPHPFHMGDLPPLIENNGQAYMRVLINRFKIKDIMFSSTVPTLY